MGILKISGLVLLAAFSLYMAYSVLRDIRRSMRKQRELQEAINRKMEKKNRGIYD